MIPGSPRPGALWRAGLRFRRRLIDARAVLLLSTLPLGIASACQPGGTSRPGPIGFDTATVWVRTQSDSLSLLVEIARTEAQQEIGLSGRPTLDSGSGMLFEFDGLRSGDEGFWMWGTLVPLDIAFMDEDGVIRRVLSMDVCDVAGGEESCPGHFPGVEHASALETNQGWFAANGLGVGARVRVVR